MSAILYINQPEKFSGWWESKYVSIFFHSYKFN